MNTMESLLTTPFSNKSHVHTCIAYNTSFTHYIVHNTSLTIHRLQYIVHTIHRIQYIVHITSHTIHRIQYITYYPSYAWMHWNYHQQLRTVTNQSLNTFKQANTSMCDPSGSHMWAHTTREQGGCVASPCGSVIVCVCLIPFNDI